jgi:hypothetical protein
LQALEEGPSIARQFGVRWQTVLTAIGTYEQHRRRLRAAVTRTAAGINGAGWLQSVFLLCTRSDGGGGETSERVAPGSVRRVGRRSMVHAYRQAMHMHETQLDEGEYTEVVDAVYADGLYGEQVQLRVVRTHNEDGTEQVEGLGLNCRRHVWFVLQIIYEPINDDETSAAVDSIQYHDAAHGYAHEDDNDSNIVEHVVIT